MTNDFNGLINPTVTVVVVCYNYAIYLEEAVQSVLKQTYNKVEIIIINDGSTDKTEEIVSKILKKHKEIKYVVNSNNEGIVSVRNKAIKLSRGEYIIQLDADDKIPENYIEEVLKTANKTNSDIVYTNYKKFGIDNETSNFPEYNLEILKNSNYIHVSSLVKRESIKEITFDNALNRLSHEDWDFFLNLCINGRTATLCRTTHLYYRMHGHSRNNKLLDFTENKAYVDVYSYIIKKHLGKHKEEVGYLAINMIANWYAGLYLAYSNSQKAKDRLSEEKLRLEDELKGTLNSKTYKLGKAIASPYVKTRELLNKYNGHKDTKR